MSKVLYAFVAAIILAQISFSAPTGLNSVTAAPDWWEQTGSPVLLAAPDWWEQTGITDTRTV